MRVLNLFLFYRQSFNYEMLRRTIGLETTDGEKVLQGQAL